MVNFSENNIKLLYQYEVLRAQLHIREFFIETTVKEIYENIGQVLSLVRMQLVSFAPQKTEDKTKDMLQLGDLVGQSIRDLRSMSRSFYSDLYILTEEGFIEGLKSTIKILELHTDPNIKIKDTPQDMPTGLKSIAFRILQEILISIKEIDGTYKSMIISFVKQNVTFIINYDGKAIDINKENTDTSLKWPNTTLKERVQLIEGKFLITKSRANITSIKLIIPLKVSMYE